MGIRTPNVVWSGCSDVVAHRVIPQTGPEIRRAVSLIRQVCQIAGDKTWIDSLRQHAIDIGLVAAVERDDTAAIFDWLMTEFSLQGISDAVAEGYIDRHGNVTWVDIAAALGEEPGCVKLGGYWAFTDCRYHKGAQTCGAPDDFANCPLPRHPLRNGRLNQTAYSLFLFIRDIAGGDIVGWIDRQLKNNIGTSDLMQRGCVSTLPISLKMARERSAGSLTLSKAAGG